MKRNGRRGEGEVVIVASIVLAVAIAYGAFYAASAIERNYNRSQILSDERNKVEVNEIKIQQTHQLIQVEEQKAKIRVVEAQGISDAQKIINATLTDKYLQHEAIKAQEAMAGSPNHTTIYIPSGQNGIPLVSTIDNNGNRP